MRALNTLYVTDHRARIGLQKGNLLVAINGQRQRVPIETVDAVVLLGNAQVSSQALSRCVERSIRVSSLTPAGRLRWTLGGPTRGNVLLRVAQFAAASDPERLLPIARLVVAGKLANCSRMIARWQERSSGSTRWLMANERESIAERIGRLATADNGDLVRGIEGDGSRRYFKCLRAHLLASGSLLSFETRTRRPPRDEMNAVLGFVYGLVLGEVTGALDSVGLDPQVGFLHGTRPGRPSLALDLLEEFRPAVADRFAVGLASRRMIRSEHFTSAAGGGCYLSDEGRRLVLGAYEQFRAEEVQHRLLDRLVPRWALPSLQATLMARHLRGDIPAYPPFVLAT